MTIVSGKFSTFNDSEKTHFIHHFEILVNNQKMIKQMKNDYSQNQIITAKYCCHKIIDGSLRNLNSSKRRASLFLFQAIYFTKAIFRDLLHYSARSFYGYYNQT